jgi:predicted ATPase/GAF domain-containing protein/anti-anti-sigma regulatory factor
MFNMRGIAGYSVVDTLRETAGSSFFRALREADGGRVLVRWAGGNGAGLRAFSALQHEHAILRDLDVPGVPRVLSLEHQAEGLTLVLEDAPGRTLAGAMLARRLSLAEVLAIAIALTRILAGVHARVLVHKDMAPWNVLWDEASGAVRLLGFGRAARVANEASGASEVLEGSLAYTAPEATGRMNRPVDVRADLYSLGVLIHEMLVGAPPFEGEPMEIVHGHIARRPVPPHERDERVPEAISRVVMKLLEKDAGARYQSAAGLRADLEACARALAAGESLEPFPLGRHDGPEALHIPDKLYGRAAEERALAAALARAAGGAAELCVVSGCAGVGKSALVHGLRRAVARHGGHFAEGKFDQYNRAAPLSALAEALRGLVRKLLGESADQLARYKERILAAVGPSGRLVVDLVPELDLVLGPQPEVPPLGGAEAQNRFVLVLEGFLRAFAEPGRPLVLFLDDMQWADPASLKLIEVVLGNPAATHMLLVAAHRDNEVDAAHPWSLALTVLRRVGVSASEVVLAPLTLDDVADLLADTLGQGREGVLPLARAVFERTQGNPFYTRQLLGALHEEGILRFDAARGAWAWDLGAAYARAMAADVVAFMASRIESLPAALQEVLKLAACIGHMFDRGTLEIIHAEGAAATAAALEKALEAGLILPADDAGAVAAAGDLPARMQFLHDRVQQAAYSLIAPSRRAAVHLDIGRLLGASKPPAELGELLFDVARHLGLGADLMQDPAERARAAEVHLLAGRKARAAAAYDAALGYLRAGVSLLPPGSWEDHYPTALALHRERAEAEVLTGHFAEAQAIYPEASARARTPLDKASVLFVEATHYQLEARYVEAIRAQREGLALLGSPMPAPEEATEAILAVEMQAIDDLSAPRDDAALLALPREESPAHELSLDLLQGLFYAAYLHNDKLLCFLAGARIVTLTLRCGVGRQSPFGFVAYAMVLGLLGEHARGGRFARVGIALADRFEAPSIKCLTNYLYAADVHSWTQPLRNVDPYYERTYQYGLASGDWLSVGYMIMNSNADALTRGDTLTDVLARCRAHLVFLERARNETAIALLYAGVIQPIRALMGETSSPLCFDDATFREDEHLARYQGLAYHLAWLEYARIRHALLFDDRGSFAARWAALPMVEGALPTHAGKVPESCFYVALMRARACEDAGPEDRSAHLEEIARIEEKLARWARAAPENVRHKLLFVQAERARVEGRSMEAMDHYEQGIAAARAAHYVNNEALGNELYGRFWLGQGRGAIAKVFLLEAARLYQVWGARAKARDVGERYAEVLGAGAQVGGRSSITVPPVEAPPSPVADASLDFVAVLRASQAIASEVVLERVLDRVLRVVVESAGATGAVLLLSREDRLLLGATMRVDPDEVEVFPATPPLTGREGLPASIVHYVARTRELVELSVSVEDGRFSADPYLLARRPRSVLCLPLLQKGRLAGVLYLENAIAEGAFGGGRVRLFELLAAQAASALENARLYADLAAATEALRDNAARLEGQVQERTEALRDANERLVGELEERARIEAARSELQEEMIRLQKAQLAELSTPLIPIGDSIMVMPLVGSMDAERGEQVMAAALRGAAEGGAQAVILDVTGMRGIDEPAVRGLLRTVNALRLLGAEAILTGVRADMARAMMELGLDLARVPIRGTLQGGIALASRRVAARA